VSNLTVKKLHKLVKQALVEEKAVEALRAEVARVMGPAVVVECKLEQLAEAANDRMDVLERTGRDGRLSFNPSVTVRWLNHSHPEVRKFAARVVPARFLPKMMNDRSDVVRAAVARRLPLDSVKEMLKRFPHDDGVRTVLRQKRLDEAGIPQPKVNNEPFDMYGSKKLGAAVKQSPGPELSDIWYRQLAMKFMQDFGGNVEDAWEETTVRRYVASVKNTSLIELDEEKLLGAIKELIEERDEETLQRCSPIKETLDWLRSQEDILDESVFDEGPSDLVEALLSKNIDGQAFLEAANATFNVRSAEMTPALRKHAISEGTLCNRMVPVVGYLPHRHGFRAIDERVLDKYCKVWNDRNSIRGERLGLEWSTHPENDKKISFSIVLT